LHPPELLASLAAAISAEDLQLYYQTAILGRRDLALAPDARTGFRMTLIRMLAFRPSPASGVAAEPASAERTARVAAAAVPSRASAPSALEAPSLAPEPSAPAQALAPPDEWGSMLAALDLQGAPRQLAGHCILVGREGATVRLALDARSAALRTRALEEKLAQALGRLLGAPVRLEIELREDLPATPARARELAEIERRAQAHAAFESDPVVASIKERFGASVLPDTVRPVEPEP
jgi:DNA polymerase-3 subunit gamma/tau